MSILGKGINAIEVDLLNLNHENQRENMMTNISLTQIVIGKYQPRSHGTITKESIQDLVESIKEHGILQPIIVRKTEGDKYEIIAGERRYLSALEIGLSVIPCLIKNVSEKDAFAIALIENIQRAQLTLLEESESLLKLKEEYFLSVEQVSKLIGKPRSTIANLIRAAALLSPEGKSLWEKGYVDYGHIRAVIVLDHTFQNIVLQYIINKKLSVRETEHFIKERKYFDLLNGEIEIRNYKSVISSDEIEYLSSKFTSLYKEDVKIKASRSGRIRLLIEFENIQKTYDYLKSKLSSD